MQHGGIGPAMNVRTARALSLVSILSLGSCAIPKIAEVEKPPPSPEERQAMQSTVYPGSYDAVFAATISVMQDFGWNLSVIDKNSGIVKASTNKRLEKLSPVEESITDYELRLKTIEKRSDAQHQWTRWEEITIHTEPWGANRARQRIVIMRWGSLPSMSYATRVGGGLLTRGQKATINAPPQEVNEELVLPEVYRALFEKIQRALNTRTTLQEGAGS